MYSNSFLKLVVLLQCVLLAFIWGCPEDIESDWSTDPPPQDSISTTNEIRRERGIRQIKDNWSFYGRQFGEETWKDHDGECKRLFYDKRYEELRWESDRYYSGATFPSLDGDGGMTHEQFVIRYFYGAERFALDIITDNKELEAMVYNLPERFTRPNRHGGYSGYGNMGKTNSETLEVADKILAKWGKKRL